MTRLPALLRREALAGRLALFCGAGISVAPPSSLPAARALMRRAIIHFTGDHAALLADHGLRPEVLFGLIERHAPDALMTFLHRQLTAGRPNANHLFAAWLLRHGNPVITTNFDTLIEDSRPPVPRLIESDQMMAGSAALFKIHGSIDRPESLVATMDQVGRGLKPWQVARLKACTKGRTLLVLGYSGLDQIDIMPVLAECKYRRVIWIDHKSRRHVPARAHPDIPEIRSLPRLNFVRMDTGILVKNLPRTSATPAARQVPRNLPDTSEDTGQAIAIDILLHGNRYQDIVKILGRAPLPDAAPLSLKLAQFMARSSLGEIDDSHRQLKAKLLAASRAAIAQGDSTGLDFFTRHEDEKRVARFMADLLTSPGDHPRTISKICHAGVELAYRLCRSHNLTAAQTVLDTVEANAGRIGDLLAIARSHIVRSGIAFYAYQDKADPAILTQGLAEAESAERLLGPDILNDTFYLAQARNNKALLLRLMGRYLEAVDSHLTNLGYFRTHNRSMTAHTMHNISAVYLEAGDAVASCAWADRTLEEMDQSGADDMRPHAHRTKACALAQLGDRTQAREHFRLARMLFRQRGNEAEVEETERLMRRLVVG